jgi:uncharacterized membrane protein
MNIKTYRNWRTALTVAIAVAAAVSVTLGNVYILAAAVIIGMILLFLLRRGVREVIADERTYAVAYKASRLTMSVTGVGLALAGAVLITLNRQEMSSAPAQVGFAMEYAVCGLLLVNLAAYTYYNRKLGGK